MGLGWMQRRTRYHAARANGYVSLTGGIMMGTLRGAQNEIVLFPRAVLLLCRRWIHIQLGLGVMGRIRRAASTCCTITTISFWFFGSPYARPTFENATLHSSSPEVSPPRITFIYEGPMLRTTDLPVVFVDMMNLEMRSVLLGHRPGITCPHRLWCSPF